jgi:AcrR family transcriptional regulator
VQTRLTRRPTRPNRREAILKAAARIFCELGFERTTVSDILRATNLRSSSFYNYFADKDEVLHEVLKDVTEPLVRRLEDVRAEARDLEGAVRSLCETYFDFVASNPVLRGLLRQDGARLRTMASEAVVHAALERFEEDLRVPPGSGHASVDGEYLKAVVFGVTFECGLRMLERTPCEPEEAARFATVVIVGGLERLGLVGCATARAAGTEPRVAVGA